MCYNTQSSYEIVLNIYISLLTALPQWLCGFITCSATFPFLKYAPIIFNTTFIRKHSLLNHDSKLAT